jgi:hypothetical protein
MTPPVRQVRRTGGMVLQRAKPLQYAVRPSRVQQTQGLFDDHVPAIGAVGGVHRSRRAGAGSHLDRRSGEKGEGSGGQSADDLHGNSWEGRSARRQLAVWRQDAMGCPVPAIGRTRPFTAPNAVEVPQLSKPLMPCPVPDRATSQCAPSVRFRGSGTAKTGQGSTVHLPRRRRCPTVISARDQRPALPPSRSGPWCRSARAAGHRWWPVPWPGTAGRVPARPARTSASPRLRQRCHSSRGALSGFARPVRVTPYLERRATVGGVGDPRP